jgi:outer membrane protein OmpA-like peptidoglycan-associated protein
MEIEMDARLASGVLVALGLADMAGLNLLLAPRLAARPAMSAPRAAPACPPPLAAAPPATAAPTATAATAAPEVEAPAGADVIFELAGERIGSVVAVGELQRVAAELTTHPERRLVLRGHTDRLGSPAQNLALSRRRAEAILRLLMNFGAPADRISIEAAGDSEPVDTSDTPVGWARNRRVELLWR